MQTFTFEKALPVWAAGRRNEMNVSLLLRAVLPRGERAVLRVAGHTNYQIFTNGAFFAQGPARAGHGFFRADELPLTDVLTEEKNVVCLLCAGYNVNSFYLTSQPSFVCAEIALGGRVLFATGSDRPFESAAYDCRVQRVQRYSYQRPFTESYRFSADCDRFMKDPSFSAPPLNMEPTAPKAFITRETLRSDYEVRAAVSVAGTGRMAPVKGKKRSFGDRSFTHVDGKYIQGYRRRALEIAVVNELYAFAAVPDAALPAGAGKALADGGYAVYDMGVNTTGYLRIRVTPAADTVLWAVFNEKLPPEGVPDPGRDNCANVVRWALAGGRSYELVSFEPYTYRVLQLITMGAPVTVEGVAQYCEHCPAAGLKNLRVPQNTDLAAVYNAAVETFRQNATDIFMDCPSRERAGWLCDSFFTARTEYALTGGSRTETAFLENFLMEDSFSPVPAGMLPMCYPSDHPGGGYIPNWAMWYLVQLSEYAVRGNNEPLVQRAKDKMYALAAFFEKFENEYGLLEKLESWVFVEWSRANDFTQDVNYPSNMLYALFLERLGGLYGDAALCEKAARLKQTIRDMAFDGTFFIDNALRENGRLVPTENHTETAQYYAFFTGVATPQADPALYRLLLEAFGPGRDPEKQFADVPVSNAFIGNFLRLEILFTNGEYERLVREIRAFFLPMAAATGTLWENMGDYASCCHGFASHVAYWLNGLAEKAPELLR